jgi:nucleoside-diphosphate-sugar epimerase
MSDLVAVTGAAGFVGRALVARLRAAGRTVREIVRDADDEIPDAIAVGALEAATPAALAQALEGVSAVVHLAARVHVTPLRAAEDERAFRAANVDATAALARAAVTAGVTRFVFASSVKVNGEATPPGRPFGPHDAPAPQDAYGRSKRDAEAMVFDATRGTPTIAVVLRIPLVIGPGAAGNVARLVDAVASGRTLPFAAIDNRRSVIGLANLCDALVAALDAVPPPGGVHFVADAAPVSTPSLVRSIAAALGRPVPLAYVPVPLLKLAGFFAGRRAEVDRLAGSLEVDTASFRAATGWRPAHTLDDELRRLVAAREG